MKKLTAILLALVLLIGVCPVSLTADAASAVVLSEGKSYTTTDPNYEASWNPDKFKDDGDRLTDGVKGSADGNSTAYAAWIGDVEIVIDLGASVESDTYTLYATGGFWGISCPDSIEVAVSDNASYGFATVATSAVAVQTVNSEFDLYTITATAEQAVTARYVKFTVKASGNFVWIDEAEVALANPSVDALSTGKRYTTTEMNYNWAKFQDEGSRLTDGVKNVANGDSSAYAAWQSDVEIVIDMGSSVKSNTYTLYAAGGFWGISCPAGITVSVSDSADSGFVEVASSTTAVQVGEGEYDIYTITATASETHTARYVKFTIAADGKFVWISEVEANYDPSIADAADPEDTETPELPEEEETVERVYGVLSGHKSYTTTTFNYSWDKFKDDGTRLTDGVKGTSNGDSTAYAAWIGDIEVVVDLGAVMAVNSYTLYATGDFWGINCPRGITVSVSENGTDFVTVATSTEAVRQGTGSLNNGLYAITAISGVQSARYVKFDINDNGEFVWIDEVEVALDQDYDFTVGQVVNAVEYGLSTDDSGAQNSAILQKLIDGLSAIGGGTVYIPAGEYYFAENGTQKYGSHCIKMKSNVNIIGAGMDATVLLPVGESSGGLDMFYFNDYVDYGTPNYLENCRFENFMIDSINTYTATYTSAGKGFMFNLFSNCHWDTVTVKNTDGTGFGVDCPIDSSISNCIAIGCGKAATNYNVGASGFGIGFGYSNDESLTITNCQSYNNRKYGVFFEHQGRFNTSMYPATCAAGFVVTDCVASGNYYNFGGIYAMDTTYENCVSSGAIQHGYCFENSTNCAAINCTSENESNTGFVILQSTPGNLVINTSNNTYENCVSTGSQYGMKVVSTDGSADMSGNVVKNCTFNAPTVAAAYTLGSMEGLTLTGNTSDVSATSFGATIGSFVNEDNSWN